MSDDFDARVSRYLDGAASEAEVRELFAAASAPDAMDRLVALAALHQDLCETLGTQRALGRRKAQVTSAPDGARSRKPAAIWLALAAAACVMLTAAVYFWSDPHSQAPAEGLRAAGHVLYVRPGSHGPVLIRDGQARPLAEGVSLLAGDRLETRGAAGEELVAAAALEVQGAIVDLANATVLSLPGEPDAPHALALETGLVYVDAPQDWAAGAGLEMAEVKEAGSRFALEALAGVTRIRLERGRVRLHNPAGVAELSAGQASAAKDGAAPEQPKTIELAAVWRGRKAAAVPAPPPAPRPVEEVVLEASKAAIAGNVWALVRDPEARGGMALEALESADGYDGARRELERQATCAVFTFEADADKDYFVWIRGKATATGEPEDRKLHDSAILDAPGATFSRPCRLLGPRHLTGHLFDGYRNAEGFAWIGGNGHEAGEDEPAVALRFVRPGTQTLRLYRFESPLRIDTILLSATQATRPRDPPGEAAPEF